MSNDDSDTYPSDQQDISMYSKRFLWPPQNYTHQTSGGNAVEEDSYLYEPIPIIRAYRKILSRTYESPLKWYFLVFAPLDKAYNTDPLWFTTKGLDACRKKVTSAESFFITKEVKATKVHINALVLSDKPLDEFNGKFLSRSRYRIWSAACLDRKSVFDYITKEFKTREPILFKDYLYKHPIIHQSLSK